jgi:hypothetical protein
VALAVATRRGGIPVGVVVTLWVVTLDTAFMDGGPWSLHTRLTIGGAILESSASRSWRSI